MSPKTTAYGITLTHVHDETYPSLVVTLGNSDSGPELVTIGVDGGPVALVNREDLLTAIAGEQPYADGHLERPERPEWLDAEVIRADLGDERVFAVRDVDGDWLIYGGTWDGMYIFSGDDPEARLSDVEIVKP